ncbi:hypothetical protein C8R46DRAFT_1031832 [Mycena filopes]|nr:hypothetical protein C8R46DRAFT_1031832 [Mycena filopes]
MTEGTTETAPEATNGYDGVYIRGLQQDPEYIRIVRSQFEARGGLSAAPTECTWCHRSVDDTRMFRCKDCKGGMPACLDCLLLAHAERPTCFPEERVDNRWKRISLSALGYVFQDGHDGLECPHPSEPVTRGFQGRNGRQEILVRACFCDAK